jgi:hypothetical protein
MSRVTVCWHRTAQEDLAELWMSAADPSLIERATNEMDQLLRINPASKGKPYALAILDEETIQLICDRTIQLPEDLRVLRLGPLEALFEPREQDRMALVLHVRLRE